MFVSSARGDQFEREALKLLKMACSRNNSYQLQLAQNEDLHRKLLQMNPMPKSCLQLLANMCVQNAEVQQIIFKDYHDVVICGLKDAELCDASAMIIHQILLHDPSFIDDEDLIEILQNSLSHMEADSEVTLPDFIQLTLEFLITEYQEILEVYLKLDEKLNFLHFVGDFVKEHENPMINMKLFRRLVQEFKRKSDDILKPDGSGANTNPKVVFALLEFVAHGTCNPKYSQALHEDSSLFINLGCLLLATQKLGKNTESIFAPVQKLDQIAPSSTEDASIESEISYSLKTFVVKALGNLLYRNKKNQELVREMNILLAIMDCTNVDARNPCKEDFLYI